MRFLLSPVSNLELGLLAGIALAAIGYIFAARLTVRNASDFALTSVEVSGRGFERRLDSLPPASSHTFWVVPGSDTAVRISFRAHGREYDAGLHGYYTAPPRPQVSGTITIDSALAADFRINRLPLLD